MLNRLDHTLSITRVTSISLTTCIILTLIRSCVLERGLYTCSEYGSGRPASSMLKLGRRSGMSDLYTPQVRPSTTQRGLGARDSSVSLIWHNLNGVRYYYVIRCLSLFRGYLWWSEKQIIFNTLLTSTCLSILFELRGVVMSTQHTHARSPKRALMAITVWITEVRYLECS